MTQLFANNISTTLNGAITAVATSIVVTSGTGMPSPAGGDYFLLTITDGTNVEIVKCTSRSVNTLTVVRAQEGTAGFAFANLDSAEIRATAGTLALLQSPTESFIVAASDEATPLTTGAAKVTFRIPYAFTLLAVRASVTTAPTGATITADINEGGVSILSTKLTIDATELTSATAAVPAVILDSALADDAQITIDIDQVGSTIAGTGLKITLIGVQS